MHAISTECISGKFCRADLVLWCQVNIQAYLLWERAGRPDGADFAQDARATLEAQLRAGKSVQDLEAALNASEPKVTCPCLLLFSEIEGCSWWGSTADRYSALSRRFTCQISY